MESPRVGPEFFVRAFDGNLISMVAWQDEERFHYTLDGQDTVLALTAEDSESEEPDAVYDYGPYGEQSAETVEDTRAGELNPFGYTGAYQFQDGTVHLSHRFLDTFTHNFTQADPSRQDPPTAAAYPVPPNIRLRRGTVPASLGVSESMCPVI